MSWEPRDFLIATAAGPYEVYGYTYRGIGLHIAKRGLVATWSITHLGSGHCIGHVTGKVAKVFPIATEIAEVGDWDFDGLEGYRNSDPQIKERAAAIIAKHRVKRIPGEESAEVARSIALRNAG